jgi:hypothetical protein
MLFHQICERVVVLKGCWLTYLSLRNQKVSKRSRKSFQAISQDRDTECFLRLPLDTVHRIQNQVILFFQDLRGHLELLCDLLPNVCLS